MAADPYRLAVMDSKFRDTVRSRTDELRRRCQQIQFFSGRLNCVYFSTAVKLCVQDLRQLGFRLEHGEIWSPEGERLWPMK